MCRRCALPGEGSSTAKLVGPKRGSWQVPEANTTSLPSAYASTTTDSSSLSLHRGRRGNVVPRLQQSKCTTRACTLDRVSQHHRQGRVHLTTLGLDLPYHNVTCTASSNLLQSPHSCAVHTYGAAVPVAPPLLSSSSARLWQNFQHSFPRTTFSSVSHHAVPVESAQDQGSCSRRVIKNHAPSRTSRPFCHASLHSRF